MEKKKKKKEQHDQGNEDNHKGFIFFIFYKAASCNGCFPHLTAFSHGIELQRNQVIVGTFSRVVCYCSDCRF